MNLPRHLIAVRPEASSEGDVCAGTLMVAVTRPTQQLSGDQPDNGHLTNYIGLSCVACQSCSTQKARMVVPKRQTRVWQAERHPTASQ